MHTNIRDTSWLEEMRVRLTADLEEQTAHLERLLAAGADPEEGHTRDAMIAATRHSLDQIRDALRRMEQGVYGSCDRCGQPIPRERLEALPHARYCVPCVQRQG